MKAALLTSSLSRTGGGVAEVVLRLAQHLIKLPHIEIEAFGLYDDEVQTDLEQWDPIPAHVFKVTGPRGFGYAGELISSLKNSGAHLIHLHGLWQYPSLASLKTGMPYVTTIHGMLDQWAVKNSGFKKKIAAALYEKEALKKANCLQAFTNQEFSDIRRYGLTNPVCIIPNGVNIPQSVASLRARATPWTDTIFGDKKILLYLGRIHPKKGLTNLIRAWKQSRLKSSDKYANWNLVIAGWDQGGYEQDLKNLSKDLKINDSVHFIGPQFHQNKELVFAFSHGFILPSFSEGLPMAVLEAWAYELPVLMTEYCNLPEGFSSGSAFKIEPTVESIADGLIDFFSSSEQQRIDSGMRGRKLVSEKFTWGGVAEQMSLVYKWVIGEGEKPDSIKM